MDTMISRSADDAFNDAQSETGRIDTFSSLTHHYNCPVFV